MIPQREQKTRCNSKALQYLAAACETICPGEDLLKSLVYKSITLENQEKLPVNGTITIRVDIYKLAETWTFRRQVLSILTKKKKKKKKKKKNPHIPGYE